MKTTGELSDCRVTVEVRDGKLRVTDSRGTIWDEESEGSPFTICEGLEEEMANWSTTDVRPNAKGDAALILGAAIVEGLRHLVPFTFSSYSGFLRLLD